MGLFSCANAGATEAASPTPALPKLLSDAKRAFRFGVGTLFKSFRLSTSRKPSPLIKAKKKPTSKKKAATEADDFISVARRLGADESKERFEAKLKKIAKAKPSNEKR